MIMTMCNQVPSKSKSHPSDAAPSMPSRPNRQTLDRPVKLDVNPASFRGKLRYRRLRTGLPSITSLALTSKGLLGKKYDNYNPEYRDILMWL